MSILVFCDHDNGQFGAATLNAVSAAQQIGGDIHLLVAVTHPAQSPEAAAIAVSPRFWWLMAPNMRMDWRKSGPINL